jgi:REP element-mobilizing transposase RayT
MPTDIPPITYGTFYHIYNRGNNSENIFIQERNYAYFMDLWWKHISPIAETWAYCLLRNHFHATVFIKNKEDLTGFQNLSGLKLKEPSQYFSNFFNAYSRGVNIATQRTGALFERPFKRIPVDSESYLTRLIVYVHQNPQKHKFEDTRHTTNLLLMSQPVCKGIKCCNYLETSRTLSEFIRKFNLWWILRIKTKQEDLTGFHRTTSDPNSCLFISDARFRSR